MTEKKIVTLVETNGNERTYQMNDGSIEKRTGGTVAWRNNNPGNLKFEYANSADHTVRTSRTKEKALSAAQSKYEGVVALDQWGNAIFEDMDAGRAAKIKLLTGRFSNLNVHNMIREYSKPDYSGKTHWDSQEKTIYNVARQQGVDLQDKKIGDMTSKELSALADGISKFESWKEGIVTVIPDSKKEINDNNEMTEPLNPNPNKSDKLRALIQGFKNDTDGSFAAQVLAENSDVVENFRERQQERLEQLEQVRQREAVQDRQPEIHQERSFGGRSF